ncbi:hypothetical protein ILYODFUR_032270 [Ilyodon furcidens]|uniref:AB hydrolase-1 domain-containing protein n=1 Tax=Ilyodon furcidens TaxID=33524 RepID=A0ABV0UYW7_9TELE
MMESPRGELFSTPDRDAKMAGYSAPLVRSTIGRNNSQRPLPDLKVQGCDPLIHPGKSQHKMTELRCGKQTHPGLPSLPACHSRVEESPTLLKELGSRAHAVCGGEPDYPSQYLHLQQKLRLPPHHQVTFHVPRASLSIRISGRQSLCLQLPPDPLRINRSWLPLQVAGPLGNGLASLAWACPGHFLPSESQPPGLAPGSACLTMQLEKPQVIHLFHHLPMNVDSAHSPVEYLTMRVEKGSRRWLKKGLLAAVAVCILVPVTYKIIPALLQDIIYTYRLSVPFFVDLSRPADLSLNHTINMYLTSEEGISLGVWHTVPESRWKEAQGKDLMWYQNTLNDGSPIFIFLHGNTGTR